MSLLYLMWVGLQKQIHMYVEKYIHIRQKEKFKKKVLPLGIRADEPKPMNGLAAAAIFDRLFKLAVSQLFWKP